MNICSAARRVQSQKFKVQNIQTTCIKYSHSCEAADKSLEEVRWSESTSDHSCENKVPASKIQILKEDMQILSDVPECVSMSPSSEVLISRWQATNASSREAACGEDPEARSSDCITAGWKSGSS